jgi:serine/threonine-protein kinase
MTEEGLVTPGADPRIGMVLQDRYRIVRLLGEGGMGAVYEGEHVLIKRRVAIKCLHAQFATNPQIVARFHREALAATSIGNEHIIEVTDMGRFPDGSVYMVLEFLEGKDFAHAIEDGGPMPLGRVVHITEQVCDALGAAHAKGIVHRDLKPENVFLITRSGDSDFVKVLDFGISKFKDEGEGGGHSMTRTGTRMGTPYYMSAEQAEGKKDVDHRADIYALGVMVFRALTGVYPFDDESFPMLILKICTAPPPSLRHYRPDLPQEVEDIVNKLLAKKREERFQSCEEIKAAFAPYRQVNTVVERSEVAARAATAPPTQTNLAMLASATATAAAASAPAVPMSQTGSDRTIDPVQVPQPVAVPKKSGSPIVAIGGGLVALAGLAVALRVTGVLGGSNPGDRGVAAPPVVHAAAAPTPAAPPSIAQAAPPIQPAQAPQAPAANPQPASPVSDRTVTIRINTNPDDAELYLDNARIANPFDGELPFSDQLHRLEARRAGYRVYVQDLTLNMQQRVAIRMHRGQGTEDHRRAPTATASAPGGRPSGTDTAASNANAHAAAGAHAPTTAAPAAPAEAPAEHPATVVVPPVQTTLRHRAF